MNLKKALTPKNTEELKPGFYVQNKGGKYRQILPIVWNGKYLWREQLKTIFTFRTFITILIILFLAWSYVHDVKEYRNFYNKVMKEPNEFCKWVDINTEQNIKDGEKNSFVLPMGNGANIPPL